MSHQQLKLYAITYYLNCIPVTYYLSLDTVFVSCQSKLRASILEMEDSERNMRQRKSEQERSLVQLKSHCCTVQTGVMVMHLICQRLLFYPLFKLGKMLVFHLRLL